MTDGRSLGTLVARASRWQTVKLGATQRGAGTVANRRKPAANPVEQGRGVCHEADLFRHRRLSNTCCRRQV